MGRRWTSIAGAASYGVVAGLTFADKDPVAFFVALALAAAVVLLAAVRAFVTPSLIVLVTLATGIHMSIALFLHAFLPGFGGGFTGDDANYFRLSEQTARYVQGLPVDSTYSSVQLVGGYSYHFGTFVYLETGLFRLFGPDVRIPLLMNATLAVVTSILIYASASLLFDRRTALLAAAIVAFYPSLIIWSALNLRDSLIVAVATLAVWSLISFATKPRPITLIVPFVAAAELVNLRGYVAAIIAISAVLSIAVSLRLPPARKLLAAAVIASVAGLIVMQSASDQGLTADQLLGALETERASQAIGANTAFVDATVPSDVPVLVRTLNYVPKGLAYAIFAPVPLIASRPLERIAGPEMLIWYVLCVSAAVTLWRDRREWRALAPPTLTIVGILLLLALAEGSVGGLFRHRGMVVPFMALLAAPTALRVLRTRLGSRRWSATSRG